MGGGALAVPLQRRLLGTPIRVAIANSAAVIVATAAVGASVKNYAYVTEHAYSIRSFLLAAVLIPTAIVGSLIGSTLTHRLPVRTVKSVFLVLMLVVAVRLIHGAIKDLL